MESSLLTLASQASVGSRPTKLVAYRKLHDIFYCLEVVHDNDDATLRGRAAARLPSSLPVSASKLAREKVLLRVSVGRQTMAANQKKLAVRACE